MKGITAVLTLGVVLVSVGAQAEPFTKKRLRRGPRYVRQDIQVTLAPSVSRRVIPFAATVLRSGTPRRYRSRVPSLNDSTPSI